MSNKQNYIFPATLDTLDIEKYLYPNGLRKRSKTIFKQIDKNKHTEYTDEMLSIKYDFLMDNYMDVFKNKYTNIDGNLLSTLYKYAYELFLETSKREAKSKIETIKLEDNFEEELINDCYLIYKEDNKILAAEYF